VVRGRIDRVDAIAGGSLVIDYKTGAAPSTTAVRRGLALQPVIYAAAAAQRRGGPVAAVYQSFTADGARRSCFTGDPPLLDRVGAKRSARVDLDGAGRARVLHYAAEAVRRMRAGTAHTTLAEPEEVGCASCPYRRVCRHDRARALHLEGDLQRPLDAPEAP
jgi:RecB family exonuclease